ncbi:hypothetical protein [Paenibacillus tundrae]|uniref:hypothetical protein n=1 Tax=Paenibacillus tundrae TaxID=528187 RepID=UPI0030CDEE84
MKKSIIILGASAMLLSLPGVGLASDLQSHTSKKNIEERVIALANSKGVKVTNYSLPGYREGMTYPQTWYYVEGTYSGYLTYAGTHYSGGVWYPVYSGTIYDRGIQ